MKCYTCNDFASEHHHIIFRSQGGTDNEVNLIGLCQSCHFAIHHGKDKKERDRIKNKCYDLIKNDLDKCWQGKIKPKIIRILEEK